MRGRGGFAQHNTLRGTRPAISTTQWECFQGMLDGDARVPAGDAGGDMSVHTMRFEADSMTAAAYFTQRAAI